MTDDNSNLVRTTTRSWKELVLKAWGKDYNKPDVAYEFSHGRKFDSTDNTEHGFYRSPE